MRDPVTKEVLCIPEEYEEMYFQKCAHVKCQIFSSVCFKDKFR